MKKTIIFILTIFTIQLAQAQEELPSKWRASLSIGQYPTSIGVPKFSPLHLGIKAGIDYQWNSNNTHQLVQSGNLAYFYHQYFQHAVQLYTEVAYDIHLENGWRINPFSIGGGYVLSVLDMSTVEWNTTTQQFETVGFPANNNWLISVGAGVGYESNLKIQDRPITFLLDYRLQIQGIVMRENVPFAAYSPLMIGVSMPL